MSLGDKLLLLLNGFFPPLIVIGMIRFINAEPIDWVWLVIGMLSAAISVYRVVDIIKRALDG